MRPRGRTASPDELARQAVAEPERILGWLRLAAIVLLAAGHALPHPNRQDAAFEIALAVYGAFAAGFLALVRLRGAGPREALVAAGVDVAAITTLAAVSGGPFSQARLAYFLIPVAVALRFRPAVTALAASTVVAAYLVQGLVHPAGGTENGRFLLVQAGYLLWIGAAAVAGSYLLARRTHGAIALAGERARLLADALGAEERERKRLSEGLHDGAIQSLLSVRHAIQEAEAEAPHAAHASAERELVRVVGDLRETIFELHPTVLEEAGLAAALAAVARRAAERGGFLLDLRLDEVDAGPLDPILFAAGRELLANAVEHARATEVTVELRRGEGAVLLRVADDVAGFDPDVLGARIATGHIGIASQRARVEAVGGTFSLATAPGEGTDIVVRVPEE